MLFFSILTVTYNRAHTLHRPYNSLVRIEKRNFEWVVVDNGSSDATQEKVLEWKGAVDFEIIYHRISSNKGKAAGFNLGLELISGDYFIDLDSDDGLTENAIELAEQNIRRFDLCNLPDVCGICFRCIDERGDWIGERLPRMYMCSSRAELAHKYGLSPSIDFASVIKVAIGKQFKLIESTPPNHVPEAIIWRKMAKTYKSIFIDASIKVAFRHDGIERLTNPHDRRRQPRSIRYRQSLSILNDELDWFWFNPSFFFDHAARVRRYALHIGKGIGETFSELESVWGKALFVCVGVPLGWCGYAVQKISIRNDA